MNTTTSLPAAKCPVRNRVWEVMQHTSRYSFKGQARLSADAGLARSTVSRLLTGKTRPSFVTVERIALALERQVGHPLDLRDLVTAAEHPTSSACQLVGCKGCPLTPRPAPAKI